jgi:Rps23 Pro-64 3,4-dihydroxylase Tpa1-like proline 4-hydroxylase
MPSVVLDEFLVWQELSAVMAHAAAHELAFHASHVVAGTDPAYREHRRSRVLVDVGPFHAVIADRLRFHLAHITDALGVPRFEPSRIEAQLTASGDGDYYRLHDDNTRGCPPTRAITFVYFCHREPRPFDGGELVLHEPGGPAPIAPAQNTVVLFPSSLPHEILPVRCPSGRFCDSRFTLNGWIHR